MQLTPADNITVAIKATQNTTYTCELLTSEPNVKIVWEIQHRQIPERDYETYAGSGIYISNDERNLSTVVITAEGRRNLNPNQTQRAIPILCYLFTTTTLFGERGKSSTSFMILFGM